MSVTSSGASESDSRLSKVLVAAILTESLGHKVFGTLLEESFAESNTIDLKALRLSENRDFRSYLFSALFNRRLPGKFFADSNVDLRKFRTELTTGYIGYLLARRTLLDKRPQILHFNTQVGATLCAGIATKVPVTVSLDMTAAQCADEMVDQRFRFTHWPNRALEKRLFDSAAMLFPMSNWCADSLRSAYGIASEKIEVVSPTVDCSRFALPESKPSDHGAKVRLLFVGNDLARKGFYDLLPIFNDRLSQRCELHVVTNSPVLGDFPGVFVHRGVSAYSADWFELYRTSDLFILPTTFDAFGFVFLEAMAAALPIVATRINAIPEIVESGVTGLLVERSNPAQLMEALELLIADRSLRLSMGAAGRQKASTQFSPGKSRRMMEAAFMRIAAV